MTYKNIKHKKTKDMLLWDRKNDKSEFIQTEIKQKSETKKLNLHNKEEYQTLVDRRIIDTLEKINWISQKRNLLREWNY